MHHVKVLFGTLMYFSWTMYDLSQESGKDSQEKKKNHIKALLVAATDCEPQYLIRLLQVDKMLLFYVPFDHVTYHKLGLRLICRQNCVSVWQNQLS